jgi:uncharacterized protein YjbI with pentapeptide repeats
MAIPEHVKILEQGAEAWNNWRIANPEILPDLRGADFSGVSLVYDQRPVRTGTIAEEAVRLWIGVDLQGLNLHHTNLKGALLRGTNLRYAMLFGADLSEADLSGASLSGAHCRKTNFRNSKLLDAHLEGANFTFACLEDADLSGANLVGATFVDTNLTRAILTGAQVYGISAWDLELEGAKQSDLIITRKEEPRITVDDVKLAQFIYLLIDNKQIRDVIDTIGKKVVLILGRFSEERKAVLDAMREELRRRNFTPIVFDFEKPASKNITETVSTLAHMARFVIADITDAKSIPQELQRIVPDLPSLPIQPVILASQYEYAMFKDFLDYPWVLLPHRYASPEDLIASLAEKVVRPALAKSREIEERRGLIESELSKGSISEVGSPPNQSLQPTASRRSA